MNTCNITTAQKKKEIVIYTETNTLGNYIVWYL